MSDPMILDIKLPDDRTAKIWRYMDIAKFLSLINSKSLYFSRADNLGDPFEGSITPGSIKDFRRLGADEDYANGIRVYIRRLREWSYASCWHLSGFESAALWNLYSRPPGGIAIQSTLQRLLDCVSEKMDLKDNVIQIQDGCCID